jgi:nucleotide-binding universal stress UspA family protein
MTQISWRKGGLKMFERLIVAADFSEESVALVKCLKGLRAFGAKDCLLLQCLSVEVTASLALAYSSDIVEKNLKKLKEILEQQGYTVKTSVVPGFATSEINRIAVEQDYSIIVVGAKKQTLVGEVLFGGLAYDIIHQARKPVLIVRLTGAGEEGCGIGRRVLFPTDFSENAEKAFEYVLKMAGDGLDKATLIHIQDRSRISPHLEDRLSEFNETDMKRLEELKKRVRQKGCEDTEIILKYGSPAVEIIQLAREKGNPLIVMGSQGRGFVKELFLGSVSHNVMRHADSSVLLVPAKR